MANGDGNGSSLATPQDEALDASKNVMSRYEGVCAQKCLTLPRMVTPELELEQLGEAQTQH